MRSSSRGGSCEKSPGRRQTAIPDQLRTPRQPQANRKDLQRFLGLNDDNEMVYIRNVRKPQKQDSHNRGRATQSGLQPGGGGKCECSGEAAATISSVCSCLVCSHEYNGHGQGDLGREEVEEKEVRREDMEE